MKLYVWIEFAPDYSYGLAFAIANTIQQAQQLVIEQVGYCPPDWGLCQEFELDDARAFACTGGA